MIPGQIDNSLLPDACVAAGDDNRLAVHPGVRTTYATAKIPKIAKKSTYLGSGLQGKGSMYAM